MFELHSHLWAALATLVLSANEAITTAGAIARPQGQEESDSLPRPSACTIRGAHCCGIAAR